MPGRFHSHHERSPGIDLRFLLLGQRGRELPALRLGLSQGTGITVGGSNPGLCYQARREVAVNFTTD